MASDLLRFLAPLRSRIANLVARAVVQLVDDSTKMQMVQLVTGSEEETRAGIERFQNYGFTSVPKAGAEAVVLFVGGRRDHGLAIVVEDRRYRVVGLAEGEVAVFDQTGSKITLKANGDIEAVPSSGTMRITGALVVSGDVTGNGTSLHTHTHAAGALVSAAPGNLVTGTTGAPI